MTWKHRIVFSDGKPFIRASGVPVEHILDLIRQGVSPDEILKAHPGVTTDDFGACMGYGMERPYDREMAFPRPEPGHVLSKLTGLSWRAGQIPEVINSEEDPPYEWDPRRELIPIDDYLGLYNPVSRRIILWNKGIESAATVLRCAAKELEHIVRYHEFGHAIVHLGFDKSGGQCDLAQFRSIDRRIQESLAQLLAFEGMTIRIGSASDDEERSVWLKMRDTVLPSLESRQPPQYRNWRHFLGVRDDKIHNVIVAVRKGLRLDGWDGFALLAQQ